MKKGLNINKDAMAKAYEDMSKINLGISNYCLLSENEGYNKGVEYIAIQSSN